MSDERDPVIDEVITELMQEMPEPAAEDAAPSERESAQDEAPEDPGPDESQGDAPPIDYQREYQRAQKTIGKLGGRIGHLERQLRGGESLAPSETAEPLGEVDFSEVQRQVAERAVREYPDLPALSQRLAPLMAAHQPEIDALIRSGNPHLVEAALHRALRESRAQLLAQDEMRSRRADSLKNLDEARRRATPPAAGIPSPPRPQPKSLNDLSVAELDAMLKGLPRP